MITRLLLLFTGLCFFVQARSQQDLVAVKQNPKVDHNLSPAFNNRINPKFNSAINPTFNWNYNPLQNSTINPDSTIAISPLHNESVNPKLSELLNPMLNNILHPMNLSWQGRYLFDSSDNLIAFVTVASQNVLLCFNKSGQWTCYFVRTPKGTYNQFTLAGEWTGKFLCPDSVEGFNLFNKEGVWTGSHLK
jgi:hypothetical protein